MYMDFPVCSDWVCVCVCVCVCVWGGGGGGMERHSMYYNGERVRKYLIRVGEGRENKGTISNKLPFNCIIRAVLYCVSYPEDKRHRALGNLCTRPPKFSLQTE